MRTLWVTDIHLNFLSFAKASKYFGESLRDEHEFDSVLITGDIAEAHNLKQLLGLFASGIGADKKIFWIPGNHDHYGSSLFTVNQLLSKPLASNLVCLDYEGTIELAPDIGMVGQYAWYDGRNGKANSTDFFLQDFRAVAEFRTLCHPSQWTYDYDQGSRVPLLTLFRQLADDAAKKLEDKLRSALETYPKVVVATHVPPFPGSAWHEGKPSEDDALPWFSCKAVGDMLERMAIEFPDNKLLVVCGHSHSPGVYSHADNLLVVTGKAVYGAPDVAGMITEESFENW